MLAGPRARRGHARHALAEITAVTDATSRSTNALLDANGQTVASIDSGGNTALAVFNGAGANGISVDANEAEKERKRCQDPK